VPLSLSVDLTSRPLSIPFIGRLYRNDSQTEICFCTSLALSLVDETVLLHLTRNSVGTVDITVLFLLTNPRVEIKPFSIAGPVISLLVWFPSFLLRHIAPLRLLIYLTFLRNFAILGCTISLAKALLLKPSEACSRFPLIWLWESNLIFGIYRYSDVYFI